MSAPAAVEGRVYEIDVPLVLPPIRKNVNRTRLPQLCPYNINWRIHWRVKHEHATKIIRSVMNDAKRLKIPKADHLTVQLHWAPGDNRSADTENLTPSLKHACDALARPERKTKTNAWVGLHLVPDDVPEYMTKLENVIHPGPEHERRLWITVRIGRPPCTCTAGCDHHQ